MTGLSASMHVAAEVWNALGVELTIFALTFTIGHMVQFVANCKFAQGAKQKKGMERGVWRSAFDRVGRRLCFGGAWLAGCCQVAAGRGVEAVQKKKKIRQLQSETPSKHAARRCRGPTTGSSRRLFEARVDHLAQAWKIKSNEPPACHRTLEMYDTLRRDNCVVMCGWQGYRPPPSTPALCRAPSALGTMHRFCSSLRI